MVMDLVQTVLSERVSQGQGQLVVRVRVREGRLRLRLRFGLMIALRRKRNLIQFKYYYIFCGFLLVPLVLHQCPIKNHFGIAHLKFCCKHLPTMGCVLTSHVAQSVCSHFPKRSQIISSLSLVIAPKSSHTIAQNS